MLPSATGASPGTSQLTNGRVVIDVCSLQGNGAADRGPSPLAPAAQAASTSVPQVTLSTTTPLTVANCTTTIGPVAEVTSRCPLQNAKLKLTLTPSLNISPTPLPSAGMPSYSPPQVTQIFPVIVSGPGNPTLTQDFGPFQVQPYFAADGQTIFDRGGQAFRVEGANVVSDAQVHATRGGGPLIQIDYPEATDASTRVGSAAGIAGGDRVEGVLYESAPIAAGQDFRVDLTQGNGTSTIKKVCLAVFTRAHARAKPIAVSELREGIGVERAPGAGLLAEQGSARARPAKSERSARPG